MRNTPRLLIIFTGAALLVVAAIVALATGWWWLLPVVLVVHFGVFVVTMAPLRKALDQGDKPDPVTDARLEEEGADDGLGLQHSDGREEAAESRTS